MDRRSYGISTIPENPKIFTHRYATENNDPWTRSTATLHGILTKHGLIYTASTYMSKPSPSIKTSWSPQELHLCVKIPLIDKSVLWLKSFHQIGSFALITVLFQSDSPFPTWSESVFLFRSTPGANIYFRFGLYHSSNIPVNVQGVPYRQEYPENNSTSKLWIFTNLRNQIGFGEDTIFLEKSGMRRNIRKQQAPPIVISQL